MHDALGRQCLALPADPASIFLLRGWCFDHRADPRFAAFVGQKRPHQRLSVDFVGLGSPPSARGQNRCGINTTAFDSFALQQAVDPEAVKAGLLNSDDRKHPSRPSPRLLLKLDETTE